MIITLTMTPTLTLILAFIPKYSHKLINTHTVVTIMVFHRYSALLKLYSLSIKLCYIVEFKVSTQVLKYSGTQELSLSLSIKLKITYGTL